MRRRSFLVAGTSGVAIALAGCSGDSTEDDGGDGEDGGGEGGDGDANSGGDGGGGDNGGDDSGGDDTSGGNDGASDGGNGGGSNPNLSGSLAFESSFAMEMTVEGDDEPVEMSGRTHDGNVYWEISTQGETFELYHVGEENYMITQGQCLKGASDRAPVAETDPTEFRDPAPETQIEAQGTDTIDGTQVYVYEIDPAASPLEEGVTYYVETGTGYPCRIEAPNGRWEFHSWGDVEPVEKPDMNCQDVSQGGRGSG